MRVGMLMIWIQWPADRSVVTTPESRGLDGHSSIITNYVPTNSSQAPSISSLPLLYFITAQSNARPCAVSEAVRAQSAALGALLSWSWTVLECRCALYRSHRVKCPWELIHWHSACDTHTILAPPSPDTLGATSDVICDIMWGTLTTWET